MPLWFRIMMKGYGGGGGAQLEISLPNRGNLLRFLVGLGDSGDEPTKEDSSGKEVNSSTGSCPRTG